MELLAHTSDTGKTEPLDEHARAVAEAARRFAAKFDAADLGYTAGLLHDLGKAKQGFQDYLHGRRGSEPHSADGAKYAQNLYGPLAGRMLAFAIAGHHAGLANGTAHGGGTRPLDERLGGIEIEDVEDLLWFDRSELPRLKRPPEPLVSVSNAPFASAFFTRMLFSALVDADFLETERWFAEATGETVERGWSGTSLQPLKAALDAHLAGFSADADAAGVASASSGDLNQLRAQVLEDCRKAAVTNKPGLFSLSVPTGGGKTLSSLAFALDHAIKNDLDRVIYVIPFTSIVEQTASVFREALGDDSAILEHHSAFDAEKLIRPGDEEADRGAAQLRLAAQNWDRPIIVTTAVQFFESLFANRTSRCRKLHNIARSVVILDEAQTLPVSLLRPCLAALKELARGYRTGIVLCTATQPALTKEAGLDAPEALDKPMENSPVEIIGRKRNLFERLKRVRSRQGGVMSDAQLIEELRGVDSGLVIVNTRRHARDLYEALKMEGLDGARHLTTSMTAAHRSHMLDEIRAELKQCSPVRLIATSLIEAGVDISFTAVWRAWAGLDQITQAAGRCNREGELGPEGGVLTIFEPAEGEGRKAPLEIRQNAEAAQRVVEKGFDPLSREGTAEYFKELLWTKADDGKLQALDNVWLGDDKNYLGIMNAIREDGAALDFRFADIAKAFQMIKTTMVPVIIPASINARAGVGTDVTGRIHGGKGIGGILRDLQRHVVQVPRSYRHELIANSQAAVINEREFGQQFVILDDPVLYGETSGLQLNDPTRRNAYDNIF